MNSSAQSRRILLVDDIPDVLRVFAHHLKQLHNVEPITILHTNQTSDQLAQEIVQAKPDIVLLDGNLTGTVRGYRLVPLLQEQQPGLLCIGFSSASALRDAFLEAGAQAFVRKDMDDPEHTVRRLVDILEGLL